MESSPTPGRFLVRTGNHWKAGVGIVGLMLGGLAMLVTVVGDPDRIAATYAWLGVAVSSFVWFVAGVRCPRCRKSTSWWALRTRPAGTWITDLLALEACPWCGDEGREW